MKIKSIIISIATLLGTAHLYSQTGPAGIGSTDGASTLELWLKSDTGVEEAANDAAEIGDNVAYWLDQSGNSNDLQHDYGSNPSYATDGTLNYINFNGGAKYLRGNSIITGTTARTMFVVLRPTSLSSSGANNCAFALAPNESAGKGYGLFIEAPSGSTGMGLRVSGNKLMDYTTSTLDPSIISSQTGESADVISTVFYANGAPLNTVAKQTSSLLNTSTLGVIAGGFSSDADNTPEGTYDYNGYLYEVIVYSENLINVKRNIINNYLSNKYNIALTANDYFSPGDATFNNDIRGIGQESDGSVNSNNSAGWYFAFSGGVSDGEYLLMGNNNATNNAANLVSDANTTNCGAKTRWNKIWYAEKTGSFDVDFNVDFNEAFESGANPIGNIQNYVLLYRSGTSGDFTIIASATGLSGNRLTFALNDADFSTGYFTVGTMDQINSPAEGGSEPTQTLIEGPAGIGNNKGSDGKSKILMWLDANDLSYSNGDLVQNWNDKSENNNNLLQINNGVAPSFKTNAINTNMSSIEFSSSGNSTTQRLVNYPFDDMPSDEITTFTVYKTSDANNGVISYAESASNSNQYLLFNSSNLTTYIAGSAISNSVDMRGGWSIMASGWRSNDGGIKLFDSNSEGYNTTGHSTGKTLGAGGSWIIGGEQDDVDGGYDNSQSLDGEIAEIIVYDTYLSDAEIVVISNYLNLKYGDTDLTIAKDGFNNTNAGSHIQDFVGIGRETDGTMEAQKRGGLYLKPDNLSVGSYIFGANDNATNDEANIDRSADVTAASAVAAWNRMYYIEKIGTDNPVIGFNLPEAFTDGKNFGGTSGYVLLYRPITTGNYTTVTATASLDGSSTITFEVANANWNDGFYTLGTTDETQAPLNGKDGSVFYGWKDDGDWDTNDTWSDQSGVWNVPGNTPSNSPTAPIDQVVIKSGKTVIISANNKSNASLEVIGTLDVGLTTGHSFDEIKGIGRIKLKADNFPSGDATRFIKEGYDEGTVVFNGSGFDMTNANEFFNVEINLDNPTDEIVVKNDLIINGNLQIIQGTLKINDNSSTTDLNITVKGDITVESNGSILTGSADARHQLNLYGDLTNNGTIKFTNRSAQNTTSEASDGIVDVNFLNDNANQEVILNGVSNFYRIEIDKGTDKTYIVSIDADDPAHFNLFGWANENHSGDQPYRTANNNALGLVAGTVKIGSNVTINHLSDNGNYDIPERARLWIAGGTVYNNGGNATVPYGTLQISAGVFESQVSSGITFRKNGALKIEGGTINTSVIRTSVLGSGNVGSYVQSGGTVNLTTVDGTNDYYKFCLTYPENVFNMSGGTLNIDETGDLGGIFINSDPGNYNVTGGTVICNISTNDDFIITSKAPFYNLYLTKTAGTGNTHNHILADAVDVSSTNENVAAQPLVVLNDFSIGDDCFFHHYGNDITIGGDFTISENAQQQSESGSNNYGLFYQNNAAGRNKLTFNGSDDSQFDIGYNTDDGYELKVYNFTINKTAGKKVTMKAGVNKEAGNVGTAWHARVMLIQNNFDLISGTLDQGKHAVRLYGPVNVSSSGVCGVYEPGVTHQDALIMFKDEDVVITTEDGAQFGNVKMNPANPAANPITLTSNILIKRIAYYHGLFNLGSYNLKVNYLHQDGTLTDYTGNTGTHDATTEQMFYTAGNASDGGLSYYVPANTADGTTFFFPLGVSGKYTPVEVTVSNVSDDGYIQISPADQLLPTTDQSAGDQLSYYWRVRFEEFDSKPTVEYNFYYDENDLDGSSNETSFVPGKVLDIAPYTRSNENDVTKVDDSNNVITFNGSGSGFTLDSANYTAGQPAVFTGAPEVYYSRRADNDTGFKNYSWHSTSTWSTDPDLKHYGPAASDYPKAGDIAVIGYGNINQPGADSDCDCWTHRIDVQGTETVAALIFDSETSATAKNVRLGRININYDETVNADIIRGLGELHVNISGANIGNINTNDIGDFTSEKQSTFIYHMVGAPSSNPYVIDQFTSYPTVRFYAASVNNSTTKNYRFTFANDVNTKMFLIDGNAAFEVTHDITIEDTLFLGANRDGELIFNNGATAHTVSAKEVLFESPLFTTQRQENRNKIWVESGNGNGIEHQLKISGNITMRTGSSYADAGAAFDLYTNATDNNVILTLDGKTNGEFNNTTDAVPDFYKIIVNKDTAQSNYFAFNDNFTINGETNGNYADKAIKVTSGTLIFDDPAHDFVLSDGGEDYQLPAAASIEVKQGNLSISNSALILDGKLTVSGGTFDMSGGNNYVEYSSSGNAEIEVSAGTLTVGSQIRGGLLSDEGILKYTQTGGTVIVGNNSAPETDRGVFEIHNTGSEFTFTGGNLEIVRSNGSATRPALYLLPATSTIGSDMTIKLGNGSTPASQDFGIRSSEPIPNLVIDNSSGQNPTVTIWTEALEIQNDINIQAGTTLDADGNDVSVGGDIINNGVYNAGSNTTYLNGTGDQTLSGSGNFNFYNLSKTTNNVTNISKSIIVNNDLTIADGTFNDNDNRITLYGDLINNGTIVYGGSGDGIYMNGSSKQIFSGTGTVGKITLDNSNSVEILNGSSPVINNELKINTGVFDIGTNLLTLSLGAEVTTDNAFSASTMIQTTKSYVDAGVKKIFSAQTNPADSVSIFLPMGSNAVYSPVEFRVAENDNNTGSITVKASHETHPSIVEDAEAPDDYEIEDTENALHFYWVLRSDGMSGFNARMILYGNDSLAYIKNANGSTYTQADYITARLLNDGSYKWDKFAPVSYDETVDQLSFSFASTNDLGISGDYTAGVEPQTATKLGAIPNEVPLYTSTADGNWDDPIWDPIAPAGGPRGSRVLINHNVTMNSNFTSSYVIEIGASGVLSMDVTYGHRLGDLKGTGTLKLLSGNMPSGLYEDFIKESGGTIEFSGSTDYSVLSDFTSVNNVIFSGTGTRNLPNENLTFLGDITINGDDATLHVDNLYDNTHSIKGDLTLTTGTFDAGTGNDATLIFNGTAQQQITGNFNAANSSDFNNIKIDNAAGVQINNDIEISNNLALTDGLLTPGAAGSITITNLSENAITESGSSSYINGALSKIIADNGNFAFPVGNASQFKQINITNADISVGGNTTWTAEYLGSNPITDIKSGDELETGGISGNDRWALGCPTSATGQVTLYWNANSALDPDLDLNNVRVAKLDQAANPDEWYSQGNTATTGNNTEGSVTSDAGVTFSQQIFALGAVTQAPLPVELIYFTANSNIDNVELLWGTASETNNDYFEVQRSADAVNFETIGKVWGTGNSSIQIDYSFADDKPMSGINYYRLKQTDFNGQIEYHKTIKINWDDNVFTEETIAVNPNPYASGELLLTFKTLEPYTPIDVSVVNFYGSTVYHASLMLPESKQLNLIPIAMEKPIPGVYFVVVKTRSGSYIEKVAIN